ncbi:hypothetical protein PHYPSEUDO_014202 [Phytophthora pseudosyringae]|uniref:Uncharacterized protein n=1 Tax=Phytophthora pseudosyringae TaxID=221518 RepID=A0A8T1V4G8_9STRA|nr:hypothetical protein PHYPSEUDO_014202 [Phytophthora pseudosyringae]
MLWPPLYGVASVLARVHLPDDASDTHTGASLPRPANDQQHANRALQETDDALRIQARASPGRELQATDNTLHSTSRSLSALATRSKPPTARTLPPDTGSQAALATRCKPPATRFTPPPNAGSAGHVLPTTDARAPPHAAGHRLHSRSSTAGRAQRATDDALYTPLQATPAPPAPATCCSHALQRR